MAKSKNSPTGKGGSTRPLKRTLGPIAELEKHLPANWWRTLFNSLYLKTDGDVVEHDEATRSEIDEVIASTGIQPHHAVLDLCCGQGRHSLELAGRGFKQVTAVDRSKYLIRLAKKRAKEQGLTVHFHEGDARMFRRKSLQFDVVIMMGNSFGYFDDKRDDEALLANVSELLKPGGILVLDIVDGCWMRQHFEPRSWEWIDQNYFVCRERELSKDGERVISREVVTHAEKGVVIDQFYAERLYSKMEIETLLKQRGFTDIQLKGGLEGISSRNEDLGMMKRRLLFTAKTPMGADAVEQHRVASNITVLMGDSTLPDKVKVNDQFNEEDFATIEKMNTALKSIRGLNFRYVDRHKTLIEDLKRDKPEFVLNLCDEGYMNDAFRELHVPALLEMLEIPYSGAAPTCLGLCYNKSLVNSICRNLDIPVPLESYVAPEDLAATIPATFPALVKPNFGDSSIGITKDAVVQNMLDLMKYIGWLHETLGQIPILIQEYLAGEEYSVGVVGNPGMTFEVLPVLEVDYSGLSDNTPKLLGYESKWLPDSEYWKKIQYKQAKLCDEDQRVMTDHSTKLFDRLQCRDYARFDFRRDQQGVIKLLEVNPNPGWCWDGKLAIMAGFAGYTYRDLLHKIIDVAQERVANSQRDRKLEPLSVQ